MCITNGALSVIYHRLYPKRTFVLSVVNQYSVMVMKGLVQQSILPDVTIATDHFVTDLVNRQIPEMVSTFLLLMR